VRRARWIALGLLVSCGARGPAAVDVDRLLATRGAIDARLDLEIRIIADPRDVAGRLALAALDEQIGRPTEAIGALEEVEALGGPLGRGHVFAPCTRRTAPCPALADPADWCHEDRALQLPRRTAELARITHLRDSGMKFAYLVLRRQPLSLVDDPAAWRVVSAPMPAKGKLELVGCSAAGRLPLRLLRRHRAPHNRGFDDADRGDVLAISAPPGEARLEITGETTVVHIEPALPRPGR